MLLQEHVRSVWAESTQDPPDSGTQLPRDSSGDEDGAKKRRSDPW
jgi:hypothetical protein